MLQDLRFAARMLRRQPGFALTAILALALAIGPNAVVFSLADAVLWRPLPYPGAEDLLALGEQRPREGRQLGNVAPADFYDWRERVRTLEHVSATVERAANLTGDGDPERVASLAVTAGFLEALRVAPVVGRSFVRAEEQPAEAHRVILSDGLWRRRYGADPNLVGRRIALDGVPHEVVGVLPPSFWWSSRPQLLVPLALGAEERQVRALHYMDGVARLAPGATLETARAELQTIGAALQQQYPDTNTGHMPQAAPLRDRLVGGVRKGLQMLVGAVFLLLGIGCANVAILLLARAGARQKETAVRMAIGAGRARLLRQFVSEGVLLAAIGGAAGVLLATWAAELLRTLLPAQFAALPGMAHFGVDARVLGVALLLTLVTGLATGAIAASAASDGRLTSSLAQESRGSTGGGSGLRRAFVVAELALSLVLLTGTGLMLVSLRRVLDVRPGFEPGRLTTARVVLPASRYQQHAQLVGFHEGVLERLRSAPGVSGAAAVTSLPFGGDDPRLAFQIEGRPGPWPVPVRAHPRLVSPSYLQTLGIPLLRGRYFDERDREGAEDAVIVNQAAARRFWPGQEAVGQRVSFNFGQPRWLRIVGVVGDVRHAGLDVQPNAEAYLPYLQSHFASQARGMSLIVRGSAEPAALGGMLRAAVAAVDPEQPPPLARPMADLIADSVAPRRLNLGLLAAFALIAIALTAEGLYGVMSYLVQQRTREIGVRMALGASRAHVVSLVLRQLGGMALAGLAAGLVLAFALSRFLESLVFGIAATEPLVYVATAGLLLLIALAAVLLPVLRAVRVDPLVALRDGA